MAMQIAAIAARRRSSLPFLVTLVAVATSITGGAANAEEEPDTAWHGKLDAGVGASIGTIQSLTATVNGEAKKSWGLNEAEIGLVLAYGLTSINDNTPDGNTDNDRTTADSQILDAGYKRFLDDLISSRFYWYLDGSVGRDNVQDVQYFVQTDTGPGWRIWEEDPKHNYWDAEIGVGYIYQNYILPSRNDTIEDRSLINGRLASELRKSFEVVNVGANAAFYLPFNDTNAWFANGGAFVDVPLSESWKLGNSVEVRYLNDPPDSAKNTSVLLAISLGYTF